MADIPARQQVRIRRVEPASEAFDRSRFLFLAPDDPRELAEEFIAVLHERLPWSRFVLSQHQPTLGLIDSNSRSSLSIDQAQPRYTFDQISACLVEWQNADQMDGQGEGV